MNIPIRLTIIALLFCATVFETRAQYAAQPVESALLDVPIPPHNRNVETYFSGESRPARPYLQLKYLSAKKAGHDDLNQLVLDLKKQAQASGADAIIAFGAEKATNQFYTEDGISRIVETATMDALAIVYPENLTFIPGIVKAWKIYKPGKGEQSWELVATQGFSFTGQPGNHTSWSVWLQKWNHEYLLTSPALLVKVTLDEFNREKKRFLSDGRTVRIFYKPNSKIKIEKLKVATNNMNGQTTIHYHYTPDDKKVASREMVFDITPSIRYLEYPEFDESGHVKGYLYLKQQGEQKEQFLRMEYEFYSEEDWNLHTKELIFKELGE